MLEKSGYALDQQEQGATSDIVSEPKIPSPKEKSLDNEEIRSPESNVKIHNVPPPLPVNVKPLPTAEGWDERLTSLPKTLHPGRFQQPRLLATC